MSISLKNFITVVLLTAGATGLRYAFNPILGFRSPLLFHIFAVAVAAQILGTLSGLAVTGLSTVLIDYFFIPPLHSFGPPPESGDSLALLLFIVVGITLSLWGGRRKRAEDELRRIRYNLETAQHIASIGSWETDVEGRVWWSPQTYRIFGVTPGTKVHTGDFYDLVHPEDRDFVRQAVAQAIERNTDYNVEHRIVRKCDGEVRLVEQDAKVMNSGNTRLIGSIKDITEKRRGEQAQQILGGLVQVCSSCRRIHETDTDEWYSMEGYLRQRSTAKFSHGMCPDCSRQWSSESGIEGETR